MWIHHGTCINTPHVTRENGVMSHMDIESCDTREWVMSCIRMSHVTHVKYTSGSSQRRTHSAKAQRVMSHTCMSHVTHINRSRQTQMIRVTHTNGSCHTCKLHTCKKPRKAREISSAQGDMHYTCMSHATHLNWPRHTWHYTPTRLSHVARVNYTPKRSQAKHTHISSTQGVMSHTCMSHATHLNWSCLTCNYTPGSSQAKCARESSTRCIRCAGRSAAHITLNSSRNASPTVSNSPSA